MKNVFYDMLNDEYIYTEYEIESSDIIKIHNSIELDVYSFKLMLNEKGFNEVEFEKHFGLLLYDSLYNTIKEICIEKDNKLKRIDDEIDGEQELGTICKSFVGWKKHQVVWRTDDASVCGFFYLKAGAQTIEVENIKDEIYSLIKSEMQSYISAQIIIWDSFKSFCK